MKLNYLFWLLTIITIFGINACQKETAAEVPPKPSFINAWPISAPYGTLVTINGRGFSRNPSDNIVKYNDVPAEVKTAAPNQLQVIVPKGAGSGMLTIQVGPHSITAYYFTYLPTITVKTLVGNGAAGYSDGKGTAGHLNNPTSVATDGQGNVYVADTGNHCIRKITPDGTTTTLAGSGSPGFNNGQGKAAQFHSPAGVATDMQGNVYVADAGNHRICKINSNGLVTTLAGNGTAGFVNGQGSISQLNNPMGVAIDAEGNVYVADTNNHRIRKITPMGMVNTLAGMEIAGYKNGLSDYAKFDRPTSVAIDRNGKVYVADANNHQIRVINSAFVEAFAGSGTAGFADEEITAGNALSAQFNNPVGVAIDARGEVFVADATNQRIRQISPTALVSTLAGTGGQGLTNGNASLAQFFNPSGVAIDSQGNVYVADKGNHCIRQIISE